MLEMLQAIKATLPPFTWRASRHPHLQDLFNTTARYDCHVTSWSNDVDSVDAVSDFDFDQTLFTSAPIDEDGDALVAVPPPNLPQPPHSHPLPLLVEYSLPPVVLPFPDTVNAAEELLPSSPEGHAVPVPDIGDADECNIDDIVDSFSDTESSRMSLPSAEDTTVGEAAPTPLLDAASISDPQMPGFLHTLQRDTDSDAHLHTSPSPGDPVLAPSSVRSHEDDAGKGHSRMSSSEYKDSEGLTSPVTTIASSCEIPTCCDFGLVPSVSSSEEAVPSITVPLSKTEAYQVPSAHRRPPSDHTASSSPPSPTKNASHGKCHFLVLAQFLRTSSPSTSTYPRRM
ncbi:hypothetical protein BV25DRAFT_1157674 [Artomyces pyxidatus]|uniref:Uncharacterized protein n=1 Tax=Artomyces pyxidatus TaxID=48021 RepID=A0ACB8STE7_9AGAM|nr:hypothetical protein BV25DRAFT_1157674 [Artomyces pyxidatus]